MGSAPAASRAPTPNAGVGAADLRTRQRNKFGDVLPLFCLFSRRPGENQEEAEHGVASPVTLPDAGSTPAASTNEKNSHPSLHPPGVESICRSACACSFEAQPGQSSGKS